MAAATVWQSTARFWEGLGLGAPVPTPHMWPVLWSPPFTLLPGFLATHCSQSNSRFFFLLPPSQSAGFFFLSTGPPRSHLSLLPPHPHTHTHPWLHFSFSSLPGEVFFKISHPSPLRLSFLSPVTFFSLSPCPRRLHLSPAAVWAAPPASCHSPELGLGLGHLAWYGVHRAPVVARLPLELSKQDGHLATFPGSSPFRRAADGHLGTSLVLCGPWTLKSPPKEQPGHFPRSAVFKKTL